MRGGWPLHYAALALNADVLRLEQRANLNRQTSKDEPMQSFPYWMSAWTLALFYKHHEAAQLLLAARALPAIQSAASSDSAEAVVTGLYVEKVRSHWIHWTGTSLASPCCIVQQVTDLQQLWRSCWCSVAQKSRTFREHSSMLQ